jgi:hypothetical protein
MFCIIPNFLIHFHYNKKHQKKTTQNIDNNLDKHNATKKTEQHKLQTHKKGTHEKAKSNGEGVPKVDGGLDKPIAQGK